MEDPVRFLQAVRRDRHLREDRSLKSYPLAIPAMMLSPWLLWTISAYSGRSEEGSRKARFMKQQIASNEFPCNGSWFQLTDSLLIIQIEKDGCVRIEDQSQARLFAPICDNAVARFTAIVVFPPPLNRTQR